ncbi:hypothetical protein GC175_00440 [bacterium]|nr:hypothetical protein [bacterium]
MLQSAYLLRFWRASLRDGWRVTLITVSEETTEQHFGTLEELYHHLQQTYTVRHEADDCINEKSR